MRSAITFEPIMKDSPKTKTYMEMLKYCPPKPSAPRPGAQPVQIPKGMSPADVKAKYKSGTHIVLPDGTTGIVP